MGSMVCGKCRSESTYYEGAGLACMKCGNRSPSRWGFYRKGEEIKAPEPIEPFEMEDEETDQEEDIDEMGKKRTPEQIERIRAGIRAAKDRKKDAGVPAQACRRRWHPSSGCASASEMPPEKVALVKAKLRAIPETSIAVPEKLPDPLPIAKIEDGKAQLLSPDPRIVLLDFTLPENADLYEPWVKYGRSHRRGPGDQAMMAVEQILTNEGLL